MKLYIGLKHLTLEQAKRLQAIRAEKGSQLTRDEKNKAAYEQLIDDLVKLEEEQADK